MAFLKKADQHPRSWSPLQHQNWHDFWRKAWVPWAVPQWPRVGVEEVGEGWWLRSESYIHSPTWGKERVPNSSYFLSLLSLDSLLLCLSEHQPLPPWLL